MRFLTILLLANAALAEKCILCDGRGLVHPMDFVDSKGKVCAQLMVELFRLDRNDPNCILWYNSSHDRCCNGPKLDPIQQDPPPPPPQFSVDGPYQSCDLCRGGAYPSAVGMVINMLYVGVGTCNQYYEWGQRGWIQDNLCTALQYFAREPCGCDKIPHSS